MKIEKTKVAMVCGASVVLALATIQLSIITANIYLFTKSTYFDWREIEAINATTVAYHHKPASITASIVKNATSTAGIIREVSAYNAGDPSQTDESPCDGAGGNICEALAKGQKVCAANFVSLGTKLKIQNYGECIVLDRMAKRFQNRVDIAMKLSEKDRAIAFGVQKLLVEIIKK
jgi:3D (Asp-Asp-Asp) domain-containing protein